MTSPIRSQVNIALMLRDNLPAALRDLDGQIKQAEARIPYLEAIIAHEDPPDPWAPANDTAMAAE